MTKPVGRLFSALLLCAGMVPARAMEAAASPAAPAAKAPIKAPIAAPALKPAASAREALRSDAVSQTQAPAAAASDPAVAAVAQRADPKKRFHRPAPLKRLIFTAREGFSLRMVSSQEVTAEIRNGAGRTLARGEYTLEAGDWTLRPRNMAPGLYTVLLRTGPQLRALRMKIEGGERGEGLPEWVLEKAPGASGLEGAPPQQGASVFPAPD